MLTKNQERRVFASLVRNWDELPIDSSVFDAYIRGETDLTTSERSKLKWHYGVNDADLEVLYNRLKHQK